MRLVVVIVGNNCALSEACRTSFESVTDSHVCDRSFPKTRHAVPPTRWVVTIHFGSCHGPLVGNRYNQAPHLTQDTNGKVTTSQLDITNESQEVSPFTAGDHKALINRRVLKA